MLRIRKTAAAFCALTMVLGAAAPLTGDVLGIDTALTASAAEVESGKFSLLVKWSLDSDGTVSVSGAGAVPDYSSSESPLAGNGKIKKADIKSGLAGVGSRVFYGCKNLKSVTIGETVLKIGEGAFEGCSSLTDIKFPSFLTDISDNVFCGCTSLKSIVIPDKVNSIGNYAFKDCSQLGSITIPKNVKTIADTAFDGCSPSLAIKGYTGTYAQTYAKAHGIRFIPLDGSAVLYGDVNGDKNITEADAALLQQYLADWKVTIDEAASDVTADGKVDEADVALLQQYLADWKVTLGA